MKAYQIVIKGDERSEEYARISRESFQPAIDAGYLDEIITFNAITPESPDFDIHVEKYSWETSMMLADVNGQQKDDHSPTEKAGMCSHWSLMRKQGNSDERFFVMEHDTYLLPQYVDMFGELVKFIEEKQPPYANIGLFMGCYTFSKECAKWQYDMLTIGVRETKFPINCGPYCTLQRLFRTYTTSHLQDYDFHGMETTVIHPWNRCDTLYFGRQCGVPFNFKDPDQESNPWKTPTTQVISKSLKVTQDHHGYQQQWIDEPWLRHKYFHIID